MERKIALLITLVALAAILIGIATAGAFRLIDNKWVEYNYTATQLVSYDVDGDGRPEVLALPYYVIDDYAVLASPYPKIPYGYVVGSYLVLYDNSHAYVFEHTKQLLALNLSSMYLTPDKDAVVINNEIAVTPTGILRVPGRQDAVYAYGGGKVVAVYPVDNGTAVVLGNETRVVPVRGVPVAAGFDGEKVFIIINAIENSVLVSYSIVTGAVATTGLPMTLQPAFILYFSPAGKFFVIKLSDGIYKLAPGGISLISPCDPITISARYAVCRTPRSVYVYDLQTLMPIVVEEPPVNPSRIVSAVARPLALSTGSSIYVYYNVPLPIVSINVDKVAYAGDKVSYNVIANRGWNVSVFIDSVPVKPSGYYVFDKAGVHVIRAIVSNGIVTVSEKANITVLPRPIDVGLTVVGTPRAFDYAVVRPTVFDHITGRQVHTNCTITVPGVGTIKTEAWRDTKIVLLRPLEPVKVACGGDGFYQMSSISARISPFTPAAPRIEVMYEGSYRLRVVAYGFNGTAPGKLLIKIGAEEITMENPAEITLPGPGSYSLSITFRPESPLYSAITTTVNITIPKSPITQEQLAKIEKEYSKVLAVTVEKTVTKTKVVPKVVTVKSKSTHGAGTRNLVVAGAVVGAALAGVALVALRRSRRFKSTGGS